MGAFVIAGGDLMFRGSCFEYAGTYSGDYNLTIMYVENSYNKFDTGGSYKPVTDTIPKVAEDLLYGLKHSENPLKFSIEIVNTDGAIPIEQMKKIKDWLFGQEGWKRLRLMDGDFQDYYLNCLLLPEEDIVDSLGYRGVRCTLQNISGFWYKDETISFNNTTSVQNVRVNTINDFPIFPLVEISLKSFADYGTLDFFNIQLINSNDKGGINLSGKMTEAEVKYTVNTKYGYYTTEGKRMGIITSPTHFVKPLRLLNGANIITVFAKSDSVEDKEKIFEYIENITYKFTTLHRIGGF